MRPGIALPVMFLSMIPNIGGQSSCRKTMKKHSEMDGIGSTATCAQVVTTYQRYFFPLNVITN